MPDLTQNIIIEFTSDTTKLQPAVDQLESIGKIEAGQAAAFKATNAEINKQAEALKRVNAIGQEISSTGRVTKKNLADLAAQIKGMSGTFQKEFQQGVIEQLKKAGVGTKEFTELLGKSGIETQSLSEKLTALKERLSGAAKSSPFADLQKQISEAKNRVFDLAAQMERLKKTGGAGTSGFASLTKELKEQKAVLGSLEKEYHAVTQSAEGFGNASKGNEASTTSLRGQLRQMVEQLALLKVQGKDTSAEYLQLAADAGKLRDAIGDANKQVNAFASDTSNIDGLIGVVQGAAGAFAVVQGAAALFGDESEELQKTLLRVNAAMAILQGLQQVSIILQKESAAAKLIDVITTKAQATALAVYNFVVGTSTGLTKAFKLALAATGVGLLVIGLIKLVEILKSTNHELEDANNLIETQQVLLDSLNESIDRSVSVQEARARAANVAESEIIRIQGRGLQKQRASLVESNSILAEQRAALDSTSEAWFTLNEQIEKNKSAIEGLDTQIIIKSINLEKQLADERADAEKKRKDDAKQAAEDAKRRREDQLQKEKEARAAGFADFKASVELELLAVEKGSREELEIKKRVLRAELQQALDNDKLTDNQRKLLIHKFFADRIDLEKQFNKEKDKLTFENIQSGLQADLAQLEISAEKKLELTEIGIRLQAQVELAAAEGNAAKIVEIEAKRDKAIRDARVASIQEVVNYEIALAEANNGPGKRRLQAILEDGNIELSERISIINELAGLDNDAIKKRIDALNQERQQGLISQKDYTLQYAQLVDQQTQIWEDAEKKKTEVTKTESQKRQEQTQKDIENILKVADLVSSVLSGIADIQAQRENEKLSADRQRIKELQDAGAITEKQAIFRMKKIDAEEKKIRFQQAKRDKEIALFNAIIDTARGVAAAISKGPAAIVIAAAIGAAQIALIAAKPLPKFAKGKKDSYQGLAQVGESGSELIEHGGKMYVAEKPSIVYLGKTDKVFSHKETIQMFSKTSMSKERNGTIVKTEKGIQIDYEKMGKELGKHVQQTITVDGVTQQIIKQKEFIKYLDGRRTF